mgnify:FL=1
MEENKQKSVIDPVSTAVYKWIKICQSRVLVVLGVIFFVLGRASKDGVKQEALSYSLGALFAVYGVRNLLSGYLLNRNVTNGDVLFGLRSISFSLVLFFKTSLITERFPIFLRTFFYSLSARRIVTGVDKIVGKNTAKRITHAVWNFIGAALLITLTTTYLVFYRRDNPSLFRYVLRILGVLVCLFGFASGVLLLIRVRNTKKRRKEESFAAQSTPKENRSHEVVNKDVKVISLSDLKKGGKKINNKAGYKAEEEEKKQIEDSEGAGKDENGDSSEAKNKEEENNQTSATFEPKEEQKKKGKRKNRF